jgi:hypothetical protein
VGTSLSNSSISGSYQGGTPQAVLPTVTVEADSATTDGTGNLAEARSKASPPPSPTASMPPGARRSPPTAAPSESLMSSTVSEIAQGPIPSSLSSPPTQIRRSTLWNSETRNKNCRQRRTPFPGRKCLVAILALMS